MAGEGPLEPAAGHSSHRRTTCVTLSVQPWEQGPQRRDQQDGLERARFSPAFISTPQGVMACIQQQAEAAVFKA